MSEPTLYRCPTCDWSYVSSSLAFASAAHKKSTDDCKGLIDVAIPEVKGTQCSTCGNQIVSSDVDHHSACPQFGQSLVTTVRKAAEQSEERRSSPRVAMPSAPAPCLPGSKYDGDKVRWSLLPWRAMRQVLDVLEHGARKYAPDNWRKVPNAKQRYFDAAMRHLTDWWEGETLDQESGKNHLAHAICCVLFLLALEEDGE
jgi:predicted RNA-binding Zn-ribbon protein involved in translation (DUF1610 family)